jgi:hypothetical protein
MEPVKHSAEISLSEELNTAEGPKSKTEAHEEKYYIRPAVSVLKKDPYTQKQITETSE